MSERARRLSPGLDLGLKPGVLVTTVMLCSATDLARVEDEPDALLAEARRVRVGLGLPEGRGIAVGRLAAPRRCSLRPSPCGSYAVGARRCTGVSGGRRRRAAAPTRATSRQTQSAAPIAEPRTSTVRSCQFESDARAHRGGRPTGSTTVASSSHRRARQARLELLDDADIIGRRLRVLRHRPQQQRRPGGAGRRAGADAIDGGSLVDVPHRDGDEVLAREGSSPVRSS